MSIKKVLFGLFASIIIIFSSASSAFGVDDIYTDIILINGVAVLADYDQKGEVLKEYAEVPYYFSSYQSHETIVRKTTAKFKGLSVKPHKVFDNNHFLAATNHLDISSSTACNFDIINDKYTVDYLGNGHIQAMSANQFVAIRQKVKFQLI